jgi:hypothetical protein
MRNHAVPSFHVKTVSPTPCCSLRIASACFAIHQAAIAPSTIDTDTTTASARRRHDHDRHEAGRRADGGMSARAPRPQVERE